MADVEANTAHIRSVLLEELDDVSILIRQVYLEFEAFFSANDWEAYLRDIENVRSRLDSSELLVAEEDGLIIGTVTFYPDASRSGQERWPSGWAAFRLLAVHPHHRGRGIGGALVRECLVRSRRRRIAVVALHTTAFMEAARGMYESMGFVRTPDFDFYAADGMLVMAYSLDV